MIDYFCSCVKYWKNKKDACFNGVEIMTIPLNDNNFPEPLFYLDYSWHIRPTNVFSTIKNEIETKIYKGQFLFFEKPFKLLLEMKVYFTPEGYGEEKRQKEKEKTINELKTFKLEQCVICLENTPNVLFCNCGHICKTCMVFKLDNCPVCKKENTILRII